MSSSRCSRQPSSRRALASLLLVGIWLVGHRPAAADTLPRRYVLIIAHNHSLDPGVASLRYADDDGARYYELFGLSAQRIALFSVLDDESAALFPQAARAARPPEADAIFATLARWNQEMAQDKQAGRQTELLFIYAGHGEVSKSGEGYVNLLRSKLTRRDLYQRVIGPAKADYVHLIIDACKSFFLVNRRGGEWRDDNAAQDYDDAVQAFLKREELVAYPRVGVILATSGDQSTHEWSRYRGGILSHQLRSAMTGMADINGDGRVEYSEMYGFITAANARVKHPEARLQVFVRPPDADRHRPLMDLRAARGGRLVRFDEPLAGPYYLEDDRGVRYAEMHKAGGLRFDVVVDRQRSYFVHRTGQEARISPGDQRIKVAELSFSTQALASRGSLEQTFRDDLYRLAYSRGFYEGFCARSGLPMVEGEPTDFVIVGRRPPAAASAHALTLSYLASAALLDLPGASHGLQLRYELRLHRNLAAAITAEYARLQGGSGGAAYALDHLALLVGLVALLPVRTDLELRLDFNLGYYGYLIRDALALEGYPLESQSQATGLRLESALGLRYALNPWLHADLRAGAQLELVSISREVGGEDSFLHAAPFGTLGLGLTFR